MESINQYFQQNKIIKPIVVQFKDLGQIDNIQEDVEMLFYDELEIIDHNEDSLVLNYKRILHFVPVPIFEVEVSYMVTLFYSNQTENLINLNNLDLLNIIQNDKQVLFKLISIASQQISQLTSSCGFTPVITPAYFIKKSI